MALYASIPFMIAHNKVRTTGLFWLNAAETWVDVKKNSAGVLSSISNFVGSGQSEPQVETHWISESGVNAIKPFCCCCHCCFEKVFVRGKPVSCTLNIL